MLTDCLSFYVLSCNRRALPLIPDCVSSILQENYYFASTLFVKSLKNKGVAQLNGDLIKQVRTPPQASGRAMSLKIRKYHYIRTDMSIKHICFFMQKTLDKPAPKCGEAP